MKILFVTDRNLTHDIRIFNEIRFASSLGYKAVLLAIHNKWSEQIEKVHLELANPRKYYYLQPKRAILPKLVSRLAKLLYPLFKNNLRLTAFSLDYRSYLLWQGLNKLQPDFDLIVAHGFSSLYPVYAYSKKHNIKFSFDAASFIPERDITDSDVERLHKNKFLFKKIVSHAVYYTYSTELVGLKLNKLLPPGQLPKNFVIANSYPEEFFTFRPSVSEKVEFVWVAQKIDLCPDLDIILPALNKFRKTIRLHIFGETTERFKALYQKYRDFVVIHDPMPVDLMLKTIAMYDIGLAVYLTYISPEKNYTLSNKIFAFIQGGLYTIASDTVSQRIFLSENPTFGKIVLPNIHSLTKAFNYVIENISTIRAMKQQRFELAKKFSWKYESHKLLDIWKKLQK